VARITAVLVAKVMGVTYVMLTTPFGGGALSTATRAVVSVPVRVIQGVGMQHNRAVRAPGVMGKNRQLVHGICV